MGQSPSRTFATRKRGSYTVGMYYLLDENGERWGGRTVDGNSYLYIKSSRAVTRPHAQELAARHLLHGNVFTLVGDSNMTIRGLRPAQ